MADRYWILGYNMGYVGTTSEEEVDVCKYLSISEEDLSKMDNSEIEEDLSQMVYDMACEKISSWVKPIRKE